MDNVVIYARVSSNEQAAGGYSISSQQKLLYDYATKYNYLVKKEFIEVETAKRAGRTKFGEMLEFLKKDKSIKHVLVEKTDRLLRNFTDYGHIEHLVDSSQITIHLVKEGSVINKDSGSGPKLIFSIKAAVAKHFIDNLSEETKKGMLEKAEQRVYPSFAIYGYMNVVENNRKILKPDPDSAPYVKKMFALYATGQYSLASLRKKMITDGMIYRNGKNFHKSTVEKILKNEFHTGIFYWKGKKYENAQHEALVSKELFREVQCHLINPKKYKSRKDLFAYTNLITCGVCNFAITAQIQKDRYIYYHCSGYKGNCNQPYIREEIIDEKVSAFLEGIQVTDEIQEMIIRGLKESLQEKIEYYNSCVEQIEKQIKVLQNRIDQTYLDKLDGKIGESFWLEQNSKWLPEKENLSIKLVGYQKADTSYVQYAGYILDISKRVPKLFRQANLEQKRKLIGLLFSNSFLLDGKLDLELKAPFDMILQCSKSGNWRP